MSRIRKRAFTSFGSLLLVAVLANPANALSYRILTNGPCARVRTGPSLSASVVTCLANGTSVNVVCQTPGDVVSGNNVWDKIDSPAGGYVSDALVNTGYNGFSPYLPRCGSGLWPNEFAMRDESGPLRNTFIFDPGRGSGLTHAQFASQPFLDYFAARGFDRNFLLWAPIDRAFRGNDTWTYCDTISQAHRNAFCPGGVAIRSTTVRNSVGDGLITAKSWNGRFIGVFCGNHSPGTSGPVPGITGTKYLDCNADGDRDPGEPGIPGWRIELYFNGTAVATTITDANGFYQFRLDANSLTIGAGTYEIREEIRPRFIQTESPGPISVPFGIGDRTYSGNDFGNFLPPDSGSCRAVALRFLTNEISVANAPSDPCSPDRMALADIDTDELSLEDAPVRVTAEALAAETDHTFEEGTPAEEGDQSTAAARVARTRIEVSGVTIISVDALSSEASLTCVGGESVLAGSSRVLSLSVAGVLNEQIEVSEPQIIPVGPFTLYLNQRIVGEKSIVVAPLRLVGPDGFEVAVAEASVGFERSPCGCGITSVTPNHRPIPLLPFGT